MNTLNHERVMAQIFDDKWRNRPGRLCSIGGPNPQLAQWLKENRECGFRFDGEDWYYCPSCGEGLDGVMFEEPWFECTGGFPGDSGPGGNTPQDPVAWGIQTCSECDHRFDAEG